MTATGAAKRSETDGESERERGTLISTAAGQHGLRMLPAVQFSRLVHEPN